MKKYCKECGYDGYWIMMHWIMCPNKDKYQCEQCHKWCKDNGPYERSDGEYECQECMETQECGRELRAELSAEQQAEAEDEMLTRADEERHGL